MAITAVNPAPLLVKGAENALMGKQIDEHVAPVVGELAAKMAKPLTTSGLTPEYRREIMKVFAKRAVMAAEVMSFAQRARRSQRIIFEIPSEAREPYGYEDFCPERFCVSTNKLS